MDRTERRNPDPLNSTSYSSYNTCQLNARFTGISDPYEAPQNSELTRETEDLEPEVAADLVIEDLINRGIIT